MAAKHSTATSPAPAYEEEDDQFLAGNQSASRRKWGATGVLEVTQTNATATGTQTAPRDEVVVGVGEEERKGLEEEEEEEMEGVVEEGGGVSVAVQVEVEGRNSIRAAERAGGRAMWWRGVALGKGVGGEEGWEGKNVGIKSRRARKRRAEKATKEGQNARRAKKRRLANEEKAAKTRTDEGKTGGLPTTTPTDREGTAENRQSLPSLDVGESLGAPAFQSSPIPSTSGVQPRLKKLKSFVFRREEGIDLTFIHRHHGVGITLPAPVEPTPARPAPKKNYEGQKGAAAKERGGSKSVNFYQDPNTPARKREQDRIAAESRAAINRQSENMERDRLFPPRALSPRVKDVRVTDAGGVGPWEAREVEKKKRDRELWRRHAYDTPLEARNLTEKLPWFRDGRRRREDKKKEEDFEKNREEEDWKRLQEKFDREREERRRREEDDERKKKMKGDAREKRKAANLCR